MANKVFKITTCKTVQRYVEQDFWVEADTAEEANQILKNADYSPECFDERIESGDEIDDGDQEIIEIVIESTGFCKDNLENGEKE